MEDGRWKMEEKFDVRWKKEEGRVLRCKMLEGRWKTLTTRQPYEHSLGLM
jgi:hypothetical protein